MTGAADPEVPGAVNFRDVGGLPADGGTTRHGVLFRSGSLAALSGDGAAALRGLGIRRIVDLRAEDELATEPSASGGIETVHLPLFLGSAASLFRPDMTLAGMYRSLLEEAGGKLTEAGRLVAGGTPALVHCAAGKDRTGVTIALILSAVGVTDDAVIADYARTEALLPVERNRAVTDGLRTAGLDLDNLVELAIRSPAEVMSGFLAEVREGHGSAAGYLAEHGMRPDELARLREALIA